MHDAKVIAFMNCLGAPDSPSDISRVLVVGCGSGVEANALAGYFNARVDGIDLVSNFEPAASGVTFHTMDARHLSFENNSFDFVYSFHALEHIPSPKAVIAEMKRVLRPGGYYAIGTPNRSRLLGYFSSDASLKDKIAWNLQDLRMQLTGRFRNEHGAHAGFTSKELVELSTPIGQGREVSFEYYSNLYPGRQKLVKTLKGLPLLWRCLTPAVYVVGTKG